MTLAPDSPEMTAYTAALMRGDGPPVAVEAAIQAHLQTARNVIEHEARVTELLANNNAEVERRRKAEDRVEALEADNAALMNQCATYGLDAEGFKRQRNAAIEAHEALRAAAERVYKCTIFSPSEELARALNALGRALSTTDPAPRDSSAPGETVWVCSGCNYVNEYPHGRCGICGKRKLPQPAAGEGGADE